MADLIKIFSGVFFYSCTVLSSNVIMNIYILIKIKRSFSDFSVGLCLSPLITEIEMFTVVPFLSSMFTEV